jgi:hypothetical protein
LIFFKGTLVLISLCPCFVARGLLLWADYKLNAGRKAEYDNDDQGYYGAVKIGVTGFHKSANRVVAKFFLERRWRYKVSKASANNVASVLAAVLAAQASIP